MFGNCELEVSQHLVVSGYGDPQESQEDCRGSAAEKDFSAARENFCNARFC